MTKLKDLRVKKIGVFRALQLGDMICSIPAIRALKKLLPDSEISLISLPWAKEFVNRYSHYFSGFVHFPGYPGLPEQQCNTLRFADFLRKTVHENFDLLLQMHGNGTVINPMIELLGAKHNAGYFCSTSYCPDKKLFMDYPEELPEIKRHLELIKFLGGSDLRTDLEFPISKEELKQFRQLCHTYELKEKEYVCVHAGARDERKWWSGKNFAEIADYIAGKGYRIVLTGTEIEAKMVGEVEQRMKAPALNLTGKTNLGTLASLLKNARMLFSNDTGVSHLAAAVKTPSVVVFLFSDPVRWAPLNRKLHEIILPEHSEEVDRIKLKIDSLLGSDEGMNNSCEIKYDKLKIGS